MKQRANGVMLGWFRHRTQTQADAAESLEKTKTAARQYLEQAGYYEGKAPHVVSSGPGGPPASLSKAVETPRQPESSPDDGDADDVAVAAALTVALESGKTSDAEFSGFQGGESGGGGASETWDSPPTRS